MCGIAGAVGLAPERVQAMVDAVRHRGPDDAGVLAVASSGVTLGAARLAILDLSPAGHMPMADPESGLSLAYNGEIYNYRDLRAELEAQGARFRSGTDTEVLLKAWARWGTDTLSRLEGMFAFAVYDARRRELVLARDRLGEKPLYHTVRGSFAFASEVRALLTAGVAERRLDPAGVAVFLTNGFLAAPLTIVRGAESLLPGHLLRVDGEGRILERRAYWKLPTSPGEPEDAVASVRDALKRSVRQRLVSDVPLGAFLSGGLDSTAQVALMADAGADVRTFSITFDDPRFDESVHSRRAAAAFGTRHTELRLQADAFERWLPEAEAAFDQPSFDGLNSYFVARAARESGLTVALTGSGADELFGGYPFFRQVSLLRRLRALPGASFLARITGGGLEGVAGWRKARAFLAGGQDSWPLLAAYQAVQGLFPPPTVGRLLVPEARTAAADLQCGLPRGFVDLLHSESAGDEVDRISRLALRLFLGERCLRDIDTTSMAVSLEVRAPFVDHRLVEAALAVPGRRRCRGVPDKHFEQEVLRPVFAGRFERGDKQGFIFPFEGWLRGSGAAARVADSLRGPGLEDVGLHGPAVRSLADAFFSPGAGVPWSRVWGLHVLASWARRHRVSL